MILELALSNAAVTLHTEGVDRNFVDGGDGDTIAESPSTRRVWIEIPLAGQCLSLAGVTLHTEGVDRNTRENLQGEGGVLSPSTRRVWIEIDEEIQDLIAAARHPPHGGCG